MRGQLNSHVFMYILLGVVAIATIFVGVKSLTGTTEFNEHVVRAQLQGDLNNALADVSYGSTKLETVRLPESYERICFAGTTNVDDLPPTFREEFPQVAQAVETGDNVFAIDTERKFISFKIENFDIAGDVVCVKTREGLADLKLSGQGFTTYVLPSDVEAQSIPVPTGPVDEDIDIHSSDFGASINIPENTQVTYDDPTTQEITVTPVVDDIPEEFEAASAIYEFHPSGANFQPCAPITIRYEADEDPNDLQLFFKSGEDWVEVTQYHAIDPIRREITVCVDHFTKFTLFRRSTLCEGDVCYTRPVERCSDSDGSDVYTKGATKGKLANGKYGVVRDKCESQKELREYICEQNSVSSITHYCDQGCTDGKCNARPDTQCVFKGPGISSPGDAKYCIYNRRGWDHLDGKKISCYYYQDVKPSARPVNLCDTIYDCTAGEPALALSASGGRGYYEVCTQRKDDQVIPDGVCADSDDGENVNVKGVTEGTWRNGKKDRVEDRCLDRQTLNEYSCSAGHIAESRHVCPEGCYDGRCGRPLQYACEDSDGLNYFTQGYVKSNKPSAQVQRDSCADDLVLTEWVCDEGEASAVRYECPYGCYQGSCLSPQSNEEKLCVASGGNWKTFSNSCADKCSAYTRPIIGPIDPIDPIPVPGPVPGPGVPIDPTPVGGVSGTFQEEQTVNLFGGATTTAVTRPAEQACLMVVVESCDCGPDKCWNGKECVGGCPEDIKICPDGTPVSRTGPNCEFEACPGMCTTDYKPVCGTNGKTYGNACWARLEKIELECYGECPCDYGCTKEWNPVCGTDGETYGNPCMANRAGATIECYDQCPCKDEAVCGNGICEPSEQECVTVCPSCTAGTPPEECQCAQSCTTTCKTDCQRPGGYCGDGRCDASGGETTLSCAADCGGMCGNGVTDPSEQCDGNYVQFGSCTDNCQVQCNAGYTYNLWEKKCVGQAICGDGRIAPGEECEFSDGRGPVDIFMNMEDATCNRDSCIWVCNRGFERDGNKCIPKNTCGDGRIDEGEECEFSDGRRPIDFFAVIDDASCNQNSCVWVCDPGFERIGNKCVPLSNSCQDDGDCRSYERCVDGSCKGLGTGICGDQRVERPNELGQVEECDWGTSGTRPIQQRPAAECIDCKILCPLGTFWDFEREKCSCPIDEQWDNTKGRCIADDIAFCGDGMLQQGEECDDGNFMNGDGCSVFCVEEVSDIICGNGRIEAGEECEFSDGRGPVDLHMRIDHATCNSNSCIWVCDPGYERQGNKCVKPVIDYCGNSQIDPGEECEFPNSAGISPIFQRMEYATCDDDSCTWKCDAGYERVGNKCERIGTGQCTSDWDCDDGNLCTASACVDGMCIYAPVASLCPEPALVACGVPIYADNGCGDCGLGTYCPVGSVCSESGCVTPGDNYCGDGVLACPNMAGQCEQCDDGNSNDNDGCTNTCMTAGSSQCGNSRMDPGETCEFPDANGYVPLFQRVDDATCSPTSCTWQCNQGYRWDGRQCIEYVDNCGNGVCDPREMDCRTLCPPCLPGSDPADCQCTQHCTNRCPADCQEPGSTCGNSQMDIGEECEFPNSAGISPLFQRVDHATCSESTCRWQCNPGYQRAGDRCVEMIDQGYCGDGSINRPNTQGIWEDCDGGYVENGYCKNNCKVQCNDNAEWNADILGCTVVDEQTCGNSRMDPGESCEFPNADGMSPLFERIDHATCSRSTCQWECNSGYSWAGGRCVERTSSCGNGVCDPREMDCRTLCPPCLPGSDPADCQCTQHCTNRCPADCQEPGSTCGNSQIELGEECEFPNANGVSPLFQRVDYATCNQNTCTWDCNNGFFRSGNSCIPQQEFCGDGIVQSWEECESSSEVLNGRCGSCQIVCHAGYELRGGQCVREVCAGPGLRADIYGGPEQKCCDGLVLQGGVCNVPTGFTCGQEGDWCAGPNGNNPCCAGLVCDSSTSDSVDSYCRTPSYCGDGQITGQEQCEVGTLVENGYCNTNCEIVCDIGYESRWPVAACVKSQCDIQCLVYDPVCGSNGQTYACGQLEAACNGVEIACEGECPCTACQAVYDPVCGVNGKTYSNSCYASRAGVLTACEGSCPCPSTGGSSGNSDFYEETVNFAQ